MRKFSLILLFGLAFILWDSAANPAGLLKPGGPLPSSGPEAAALAWKQIGPAGGQASGFAVNPKNPSEIYIVIGGSYPSIIYRSSNGTLSWTKIASLNDYIYDLALDPLNPNTIYSIGYSSFWKSSNRGQTWTETAFGNGRYTGTGQISVHPKNPKVIHVPGHLYINSKDNMAVFMTQNGGQTWSAVNLSPGSDYGQSYSIARSPSNPDVLYVGGQYGKSGQSYAYKIFKTTNGGQAWKAAGGTFYTTPSALAVHPADPQKVYAGTGWGIYRSSDGGTTWTSSPSVSANSLIIDPTNPAVIYAGYSKGGFKSTDGGVNWAVFSGPLGTCVRMGVSAGKVYYAGYAGFFRSLNAGATWSACYTGIKATTVPALAAAPSSPNVIYAEAAKMGWFKSTNGGAAWKMLPEFYRCESIVSIVVHPADPNQVFILAGG